MVDPYIGKQKRKRGESAVPEDRSPCCLMLVGALMVVAMIVGAAGAILIIDNPQEAEDLRQTQTRLAVLLNQTATQAAILSSTPPTPIPSATRTASATPSASPTSRGLLNVTATRAATTVPFTVVPPPPGTIAASAGGPSEGFEFFARGSGFPRLAEPVNVTCSLTQTGFTLDFRQVAGVDNVYYFEVTLQANGDGAFLTEVSPLLPDGAVFPEEVILTVNDSSLAASELNPDETLITAYERILERERRITAFSVTWFNTARQPDLDFAVSGSHPNAGNVFMTIRWAFRADRPLESSGTFQVC
jgi:hypothetical protein